MCFYKSVFITCKNYFLNLIKIYRKTYSILKKTLVKIDNCLKKKLHKHMFPSLSTQRIYFLFFFINRNKNSDYVKKGFFDIIF